MSSIPLSKSVALARLCLQFSRVERVTKHEDGIRPETDADHTVMLAIIACDLAEQLAPQRADRGLIAQFALVHDLVEAYAGDVQTLTIDAAGRVAKDERERLAMERLRTEFGPDSWMCSVIDVYEAQWCPEARYVKVLDKVLPKLTHLLNECVAAKALTDREGFTAAHCVQLDKLRREYPDMGAVTALLEEAMLASEEAWR